MKVMYALAACDVEAFVVGLYVQLFFQGGGAGINVIGAFQEGESIHIDDQAGEIVQYGGVCL